MMAKRGGMTKSWTPLSQSEYGSSSELDAAAAGSGKKKMGPVPFYSLYALGFTALLAKTLLKHPLFPPALDSLSWNNQWLITTVSADPTVSPCLAPFRPKPRPDPQNQTQILNLTPNCGPHPKRDPHSAVRWWTTTVPRWLCVGLSCHQKHAAMACCGLLDACFWGRRFVAFT